MATPSNPGWPTGYVPSAAEWSATFSGKADYPVPIAQGGNSSTTAYGANYNIQQRALVAVSTSLQMLTSYGVQTSVGAFSLFLPPLSGLTPGDWIEIYDVDFNAETNPVTVTANGTDQIALYDGSAGSQTLDVAGVRVLLVVNATSWRMIV